jgi:hypothetical protein
LGGSGFSPGFGGVPDASIFPVGAGAGAAGAGALCAKATFAKTDVKLEATNAKRTFRMNGDLIYES